MKNMENTFRDSLKNGESSPPTDLKSAISENLTKAGYLNKRNNNGRYLLWIVSIVAIVITVGLVTVLKSNDEVSSNPYSIQAKGSDKTPATVENVSKDEPAVPKVIADNKPMAENTQPSNKIIESKPAPSISNVPKTKTNIQQKPAIITTEQITPAPAEPSKTEPASERAENLEAIPVADLNELTSKQNEESFKHLDTTRNNTNNNPQPDIFRNKDDHHGINVHVSLDAFGGPVFTRSLYKSNGGNYEFVVNTLKNSEREMTSFSSGLWLTVSLNNFLLTTGANYSWIRYSYQDINISNLTVTNRMEALEYPLMIGYRFRTGRFNVELRTGPSITYFPKISATLFSPTTYSYNYYSQTSANSPFKTNYLSLLASINVSYKLSEDFSILIQPIGKYGMSSIYKNEYPINKTTQNYNFGFGARYQF
ncbi:MAG: hypothetical protein WCL14_02915 [Bacteroidota bacterium]